MRVRPPRIPSAVLRAALARNVTGESIYGDLLEEYRSRCRGRSSRQAKAWYRRQALRTACRSLGWRFGGRLSGLVGAGPAGNMKGTPMLDLFSDLRFSFRSFRSRPGFTITALLTLALGVGANTTVFSIVNAVLLRSIPVAEPETLVDVYTSTEDRSFLHGTSSFADYIDLRDQNQVFSGLAAHSLMFLNFESEDRSETMIGELATWNYFDVLGVRPLLGRTFLEEEDSTELTHRVAILSHDLWRDRFGSDPGAIGRSIRLNGREYEIVGVGPKGFRGLFPGFAPALWIPTMMVEEVEPVGWQDSSRSPGVTKIERRGRRWLFLKGRLKPGMTLEQAQAQMQTVMTRLTQTYPDSNAGRVATVVPSSRIRIHPTIDRVMFPMGGFVLALVGLVLLIVCANLANMFLARSSGRRREIALRLALGAGRGRLVRQLMTESVALALLGGGLGFLLSLWATTLLAKWEPPIPIKLTFDFSADLSVFLFSLFVATLTGVLFGLAPALQSTRRDLVTDLKNVTTTGGGRRGRQRFRLRDGLVMAQVAISLILLIGAMLAARSLNAANRMDLGFDPRGVATLTINLSMHGYTPERGRDFYRSLIERVRALPGVQAASLSNRLPLSVNIHNQEIYLGDRELPDQPPITVDVKRVGADYFETLGIRLVEGRDFGSQDRPDSPPVVVVSTAMARKHWPGESAIGQRITQRDGPTFEVVGIVEDYKIRTLGEDPRPIVHFARSQRYTAFANLVVLSARDNANLLETLHSEVRRLDPEVAIMEKDTLADRMNVPLFPVRTAAGLMSGFGLFALFLASVGLYGVVAYSVSRRTREIGIRMALGARRWDVLGQIVRQGMTIVAIGTVIGIAASALLGRVLTSVLYGISPVDPISFAVACLVLLGVAFLANLLPARRASRIDPMAALRCD